MGVGVAGKTCSSVGDGVLWCGGVGWGGGCSRVGLGYVVGMGGLHCIQCPGDLGGQMVRSQEVQADSYPMGSCGGEGGLHCILCAGGLGGQILGSQEVQALRYAA